MSGTCTTKAFTARVSALAAALALVAGVSAHAQTTGDGGAAAFSNSNPPPAVGDPNAVVPGLGGTSGWESWGDDPEGLISAGEANAPGNEYLKVLGGGATNAARYNINSNDDWLKRSFDVMGDAEGHTGGLTDDATTSCQAEAGETTKVEKSLYTCETGQASVEEQQTCSRAYQPIFDTDYLYTCLSGTQWKAISKTCEPERVVVVDEDYVYQCRTGTVWTHTPASCERKRIVVVDEDYKYGCVQTWNGTTHAANNACKANGATGCAASGGRTCAAPSGLPSSYVCKEGYEGSVTGQSCGDTLNVSVTKTWRYTMDTGREEAFMDGGNVFVDNGCEATNMYQNGWTWAIDYSCPYKIPEPFLLSPPASAWLVGQAGVVNGTTWSPTGGACIAEQSSACTLKATSCTEGPSTKTIDGVAVYQSCWNRVREFECGSRTDFQGCAAPAGMTQSGSTCIARDSNGVCTGSEKTYIDPSGGCSRYEQDFRCEDPVAGAGTPKEVLRDIISDTWDNGCNALAGNGACVKQGETVIEGNVTKVINGLSVTRNPWHVREDYICSASSNVNTCSPFTGCTQQSATCASKDRTGACTAYDRTYRCENPANNGGTPIETPRDVVGEYWTDPCAVNRNDPSCSKTKDEVVIGNQTRTINGLSVTRNPWKRRETWTCNISNEVETCGPVKACTKVAETCNSSNPSGTCTAWDRTYRCENPAPEAGEPDDEITDHVGGGMEGSACVPASDTTCRKRETVCTEGGETRIIDGVPVTTDCWAEQDVYDCERTAPESSNCSPPSGCKFDRAECLDENADGQCRTYENIYQCQKEVLVEDTTTTCQTKICIGDMCVGADRESNDEFPDALAAMLIAQMAGEDYSKNLTIFKGTPMRCRKAVLGFRNCCKDSGWGVDIGLTQCSQEEETLMARQESKSTHYVGTYCSQKSFLGVCLEKAMRYCSFEGTLARIVQETGRPQIGKTWGTPKEADCSGFTPEEFERIDLTDADFSDFTDAAMDQIMNPDEGGTIGRISQSIGNLMGTGSPGIGDVDEAGDGTP